MRDITNNYPLTFTQFTNIYNKVVDDVFSDGVYHPENKELSLQLCYVIALNDKADFTNIETNDEIYNLINTEENRAMLKKVAETEQYYDLCQAIDEAIEYKKSIYSNSSSLSMSDYALSQIIEKIGDKFSEMDIDKETINNMVSAFSDKDFLAENIVNAMAKGGYLKNKPKTRKK